MSAASIPLPLARAARFYSSTLGKKAVMAVTGLIGFGFVIAHLLGNLQFYLGPEALNAYGAKLRELGLLLQVARGVLLLAVLAHITAAFQLWLQNRRARPSRYVKWSPTKSSYASRTMILSGPILFFFIVYHLMHLTWGVAHPDYRHLPSGTPEVYHNVVVGFSQPLAAAAYVIAMGFLGLHLVHGVWSMFQSIGLSHPRYTPLVRNFATVATALIVLGNISIPISVLLGFYQR
jgi:succinate dehydrogenase / fumarate reductase cytochrome b subunit